MLLAQGGDFPSQRPDETQALCRRAGDKVVVQTIRHSVFRRVLPVHRLRIPFSLCNISPKVVRPASALPCSREKLGYLSEKNTMNLALTKAYAATTYSTRSQCLAKSGVDIVMLTPPLQTLLSKEISPMSLVEMFGDEQLNERLAWHTQAPGLFVQ